ncbi:hypothetical protein [Chitinophaga polysaccharea]|uniref:hypothetical protein n=1 Tax=Chitinophaga polysaccharea TaxID=1293035 RepID=UPI00115AC794|nr:hypothetical protein [Chitinophaga polysaccharea]
MEQSPIDLEKAVRDTAYMIRQYGYRNRFTIEMQGSGISKFTGNLNDCLNRYLAASINGKIGINSFFELETALPFNQRILCRFKMAFDNISGFTIKQLEISDRVSKTNKVFNLRLNKELPGSQTIEGLFPKPRPWDFLRKGKFRP